VISSRLFRGKGIVMTASKHSPLAPERAPPQATHEGFYRALEERFRGPQEIISSRLLVYLPFIEPLKSIYDHPKAVDLGCGRGEGLEILTDNGFDAEGVDLDEGMLAACYEKGLRATNDDAIAFLEKLPNDSQTIVSGFHIAEHLPFAQLQTLVQDAFRVLRPGGLLILETPNPENFKVSSLTFYLDPTHRNPLPHELLSFLPEYYGFQRIKVVRLQESRDLLDAQTASLEHVLGGASPDYAVIAQKAADTDVMQLFDSPFEKNYGLDAHVLVQRFDQQLAAQIKRAAALENRLDEERSARQALEGRLDEEREARRALDGRLDQEQSACAALDGRLDEEQSARAALEAHLDEERSARRALMARLAEEMNAVQVLVRQNGKLEGQLSAVYASTSWRIAAPLRSASLAVRWLGRGTRAWLTLTPGSRPRRVARRTLENLADSLSGQPRLRAAVVRLLPSSPVPDQQVQREEAPGHIATDVPQLSPRAQRIYLDLKAAIEKGKAG
jgi:SAM-dependent methyltransferase